MGNQLTGDNQNGQIFNTLITNLSNNPQIIQKQQNGQSNSKSLTKLRNSKFKRGDDIVISSQSAIKNNNNNQYYGNQSIRNGDILLNGSYVNRPYNNNNNDGVMRGSNIGQTFTPTNRRTPITQPSKPFNIFQSLFGNNDKSQSQRKLRSSSASHATDTGRKVALLQSNLQLSQKKLQSLTQTLTNLQQNLRNSDSKILYTQQNLQKSQQELQKSQQKIQYLQNQINQIYKQLQQLKYTLVQKDKQINQCQTQIRTQINQIKLLQNRLNQYNIRQQRKDKQLRQVSSAKFQLNAIKIRLQNNIKILQDQNTTKIKQIQQLNSLISKKNNENQQIKTQRTQLQQNIQQLNNLIQKNNKINQQQKTLLNQTINNHIYKIDQNQQKIQQLITKLDKYYQKDLQNQSIIDNLQQNIKQNKQFINKLQKQKSNKYLQITVLKQQIQQLRIKYKQQYQQNIKHKQIGQQILNDYNNARKLGQKQIQFLQNKIQQFSKQKQKLIEQIQVIKAVAVQRNRVFQRSIIYQLKQQNNRLWNKLIQTSNRTAEFDGDQYWKNKIQQHKMERINSKKIIISSQQPQIQDKNMNQLQNRFDNFVKKLQGNQIIQTNNNDINNIELQKVYENAQFYKQKCNQLENMVASHLVLNKNLKQQIQRLRNSK